MIEEFSTWLLVFLRAGAFMAIFPVFAMRGIPVQLRVLLAAAISLFTYPILDTPTAFPSHVLGLFGLMSLEVLTGLFLGFISRLLFYALDLVGSLVGMEIGLAMPAGLNPVSETQTNVPATILYYLAAVLFLALDLHHWLLIAFQKTYEFLPPGQAQLSEGLATDLIRQTSRLFVLGVQMSAPIIAVSFIVNLVFALLGRTVSQMNVFFESFSVRVLSGISVFGLTCHLMAQHIANYLNRLPEDVLRAAQFLGGAR